MKNGNGKAKLKIEGLHLWGVEIAYRGYLSRFEHSTLLVTTRTESVKMAVQKAEAVLRKGKKLGSWPQGRVSGVERKGQLDA